MSLQSIEIAQEVATVILIGTCGDSDSALIVLEFFGLFVRGSRICEVRGAVHN